MKITNEKEHKFSKIEKEVGMPVVNMGLHGNLGNAFHEQMAKKYVKEDEEKMFAKQEEILKRLSKT